MKKLNLLLSSILLGSITSSYATQLPFPPILYDGPFLTPRFIATGLAGADPLARGDFLYPFWHGPCSLTFGDIQGEYGEFGAWYAGGGVGFRRIYDPTKIWGAYLFYDVNRSKHDNTFGVISPGVEVISQQWDARLNGYFPVGAKTKKNGPFIIPVVDSCGLNSGNEFIEFHGHTEFSQQFVDLEQVGPGFDGEIGYTFTRVNNLQIHAGGYYFHLQDFSDIKGIEGRIGLPLTPQILLTAESSYDNQQRGRIVAGLQFTIGGPRHPNPYAITSHLEDPVMRNLGTVGRGNGIPIISRRKKDGLVAIRDNIFFFSPTGTATLGISSAGTFENPFAPTQFSQATLDSVFAQTGDGNFYFATGTYTVAGPSAPNQVVTLHDDQSLFGRSTDFRFSAVGDQRPILLGGLIFTGHNSLNSMQLINSLINTDGAGRVVAIDMLNAPDNFICNSLVRASSTFTGTLGVGEFNIAIGIHANGSGVAIETSTIEGNAIVNGSISGGLNAGAGIGAIGGIAGTGTSGTPGTSVPGSFVFGSAGGDGIGGQGSAGVDGFSIVSTASGTNGVSANVLDTFDRNIFTINDTDVIGSAGVSGSNEIFGLNAAVGIGAIGGRGGVAGDGASGGNSTGNNTVAGTGGDGINGGTGGNGGSATLTVTTGNGGNGGDANASAEFNANNFTVQGGSITALSQVGGAQALHAANVAVTLGIIAGNSSLGGTGGIGGAVTGTLLTGAGGNGDSGVGGNGGDATMTLTGGNGGIGGSANVTGNFLNNIFKVTETALNATVNSLNLDDSLNGAIGIGAIGGISTAGDSGGNGAITNLTINTGDGGDATGEESATGGNGGNGTASLISGNGGNGGSAATTATFTGNTFTIQKSTIVAAAHTAQSVSNGGVNSAIDVGTLAGRDTTAGAGGTSGALILDATMGNGGASSSANAASGSAGSAQITQTSGNGGNGGSANTQSIFGQNILDLTTSSLVANALVGSSVLFSVNSAVNIGSIGGQGGFSSSGANSGEAFIIMSSGQGASGTTGFGGDGGSILSTLEVGFGGNGGDGALLASFNNNIVTLSQDSLTSLSQANSLATSAINVAGVMGSVGGNSASGLLGGGGSGGSLIGSFSAGGAGTTANSGDGGALTTGITLNDAGQGGNSTTRGEFLNNGIIASNNSFSSTAEIITTIATNSTNAAFGIGGFAGKTISANTSNGGNGGSIFSGSSLMTGSGGLGDSFLGASGGNATVDINLGNGGDAGDISVFSNFLNNNLSISGSPISVTGRIQGSIASASSNLATGIGIIGGGAGTSGNGGFGGSNVFDVTTGNGGNGNLGGIGGNGGTAALSLISGSGGDGARAAAIGSFDSNTLLVNLSPLNVLATTNSVNNGINASLGVGSIAGIGGFGQQGGDAGAIQFTGLAGNGGTGSNNATGGNGGSITVTGLAPGSGGNSLGASASADFTDNNVTFTSALNVTANTTNSIANFSLNTAVGFGAIAGKGLSGGDGGMGGDLTVSVTGGNGGAAVAAGNQGGNGGDATIASLFTGAGGIGGPALAFSSFDSNVLSIISTTTVDSTVGGTVSDSLNVAVGLGSMGGIGGIAGDGGVGADSTTSAIGGNGGAGLIGGQGGNGGSAAINATAVSSGDGGSTTAFAEFLNNTVTLSGSTLEASAHASTLTGPTSFAFNTAITVGSFGGLGGIAGDGGLFGLFSNTATNGTAGAAPNGGAGGIASNNTTISAPGEGGNAFAQGNFIGNTLNFSADTLLANALVDTNLTTFSANASVVMGTIGGANGVNGANPPFGGGAQAIGLFNQNTVTWSQVTAQSNATVNGSLSNFSRNEAIGIGTRQIFASTINFVDDLVNVSNSRLDVLARIVGNNDATSINEALGLFAGNNTIINFFTSILTVNAEVLGVNLGTNTTTPTATAGTGIINF
jgi:hypothetical protein